MWLDQLSIGIFYHTTQLPELGKYKNDRQTFHGYEQRDTISIPDTSIIISVKHCLYDDGGLS